MRRDERNLMQKNHFKLPQPVGKILSLLPVFPGSLLFATALNVALKNTLPQDVQRTLHGKRLRLRVSDALLTFNFQWMGNGFKACANHGQSDLMITACAQDLLLLAQRKEDPDTLFFSRRLMMEGDTELGLLVKNTLDAIELPMFELAQLAPARLASHVRAMVKPR